MVQNLLSFARQRKPEKHQFDVIKVLEESLLLRDYDMKVGSIKLEREIDSTIPAVCGDPHQLEQVFLNIVNNAVDAMIEDEKAESDRRLKVKVTAQDNCVTILFQDSGPGIKEPHRIFEPFYTTKSVGKGTGLGLSICYGLVKEHGEISARNADGGGAIIEVKLPSAGHAAAAVQPAPAHPQKHERALDGRILVVEDEESVLEFERDVLEGAGAKVVAVTSLEKMKSVLASGDRRCGDHEWQPARRAGHSRNL